MFLHVYYIFCFYGCHFNLYIFHYRSIDVITWHDMIATPKMKYQDWFLEPKKTLQARRPELNIWTKSFIFSAPKVRVSRSLMWCHRQQISINSVMDCKSRCASFCQGQCKNHLFRETQSSHSQLNLKPIITQSQSPALPFAWQNNPWEPFSDALPALVLTHRW